MINDKERVKELLVDTYQNLLEISKKAFYPRDEEQFSGVELIDPLIVLLIHIGEINKIYFCVNCGYNYKINNNLGLCDNCLEND